jgi:tetratricopeptide (TPR) repeat protein
MVLAKADPGQFETAVEHIRRANTILEELGMLPWSACGYLSLGEVYAESGRQEEALQNLKKAESMFREMGMDYWLRKAQEALAKI